MIESIPDWLMAGLTIMSVLFGAIQWLGSMKARVRAVEVEMERRKEYIHDLKRLENRVGEMQMEVGQTMAKADETNRVLSKLSESLDQFALGLAKLETQMESIDRRLEREEEKK